MSYTPLSLIERRKLEIVHEQGKSARVIAKERNRHHATLSGELRRNAAAQQTYRAEPSQESDVQRRNKASISVGKWTCALARVLEEKLQATWSPEQIVGRLRQEGQKSICFKTIYRWL